jgi:hypothetical protein
MVVIVFLDAPSVRCGSFLSLFFQRQLVNKQIVANTITHSAKFCLYIFFYWTIRPASISERSRADR